MALQKRLVQLGLAKQAAKGAAAPSPTFTVGLASGKSLNVEIEETALNTTWSDRIEQGFDRVQAVPSVDGELIATPKTLGLLLLAALGSDTVTGTSAPYTHTFTPAASLPYLTAFARTITEFESVQDCKLDGLELIWDKSGAVKAKIKFVGCSVVFLATAWTVGVTGEQVSAGVFKGSGGTFSVLGQNARVVSGNVKIENKVEPLVASYSTTPDDVFESALAVTVSLSVKPDDLTLWRQVVTGTTTGTAIQSAPTFGAVNLAFNGPVGTALTFTAPSVKFMTHLPDSSAEGGAAELSLEGVMVAPVSGAACTVTLTNSVASY
ncbi:hypothetical protein GCM10009760_25940 [Kitasatospora kazusensis]|uniref:Major tail protein n=1 Tax=Kitasatospora kazusensis TaxID=407974 RepID=A0ABN2ZG27_9ACTN